MAYQHFYSRVPARMSMYNHIDGYDTFAKSADLSREFITDELSVVCDYKPTKAEVMLILNGKLPPVYFQFFAKNGGEMVQSCLSYISRDYTGERSAYMVHSLVMPEEEAKRVISRTDRDLLNPSLFVTDVDKFNLTAPDGFPNGEEPQIVPTCDTFDDVSYLAQKYDPSTLKRFILALLLTSCGKGKPVYVALGTTPSDVSPEALRLMNAVLQVFPFAVRANLPYVTYVGDFTKFNAFKVKFSTKEALTVPEGKGYVFDNFSPTRADGIRDEEYAAYETTVEFFYRLVTDSEMRISFLTFCRKAAEKDESLNTPTLKSVSALVFLFRQCCKKFTEREVLPDDVKVYDLFTVYERYCDALATDDRKSVYACLSRYCRLHMPIPQNVFVKFCKLYPKEPEEVKNFAMSIMLQLIHTDVMRDKLFSFIKNNYPTESIDNRAVICEDLCSVFYGGFLQSQIHSLFSKYFPTEKECARDAVVNKFLLAIRTPAIQDKILSFFSTYYKDLTPSQKEQFYSTVYEMLPYCDSLTVKLINLVDSVIADETQSVRESFSENLIAVISANQRQKDPQLLNLVLSTDGYSKTVVVRAIVTERSSQKIFGDLLSSFARQGVTTYAKEMVKVLSYSSERQVVAELSLHFKTASEKATLFDLIQGERTIEQLPDQLSSELKENLFHPSICARLMDAFDRRLSQNGVTRALEYCAANPYVQRSEYYPVLAAFTDVTDSLRSGDAAKLCCAFSAFFGVPVAMRGPLSSTLKATVKNSEETCTASPTALTAHAALILLTSSLGNVPDVTATYDELFTLVSNALSRTPEYLGRRAKTIPAAASCQAVTALVTAISAVRACPEIGDDVKSSLILPKAEGETPDCAKVLTNVKQTLDGSGNRALKVMLSQLETTDKELHTALTATGKKPSAKFSFFRRKQ